ncbi:MAG: two-component regulator propeller domain-containing protein [Mucilaginibacter sp.]
MKNFLVVLAFFSACLSVSAQDIHLKFDHFTVKDGLPERSMLFLKQDNLGYIWVGTQNGLLRYDGYKPKVYRFGLESDPLYANCSVRTMLLDDKKNLWVSTTGNGLFKYDRSKDHFIQYKYPQEKGKRVVYDDYLESTDNNGNLWDISYNFFDTNSEAIKFNPQNGAFESFSDSHKGNRHLAAKNVFKILRQSNGTLWLGSSNGLFVYDTQNNRFRQRILRKGQATQDSIFSIYEAPSEKRILWLIAVDPVSKKASIIRYDTRTETAEYYNHETDRHLTKGNDSAFVVLEDKKKRLWFGTATGLTYFDRASKSFTSFRSADTIKDDAKDLIRDIAEDRNGSLWLTTGKGLLNFNTSTHQFQRYINDIDDPTSLSSNHIRQLLIDRSGELWAGINGMGLDKVNTLTTAFSIQVHKNNQPDSYPGGYPGQFINMDNKNILFASKQGVYRWTPGTSKFTQIYKAGKQDIIAGAVGLDNKGLVYFGTRTGLNIYDPATKKLQHYSSSATDSTSISSNEITYIRQDRLGAIWIGTQNNGVCSFDPLTHKFKRYPFILNDASLDAHGKLDDNGAVSILEDRSGALWFGTNLGGLNLFDRKTGKFKSYLKDGNQTVFSITEIFEDREGRFWVGTYLNGLYLFDRKTGHFIRHFNEDNGLIFNTVIGIRQDSKGSIWVSTERGLSRLDPNTMSLVNFPAETIFPGTSVFPHDFVLANNLMVVGVTNGLATFNPNDLAGNPIPPTVHIEKIGYSDPGAALDHATFLYTFGSHQLELPYNQNRVTFNYIALHFTDPSQNKYAYRLEGYDTRWVQAGTQRSVTYTNLSPGTYTFRVKASNSDGVLNNQGDSFVIVIHPPWWQTWWVWTLYIVLFVLAIYAFVGYRSRKLVLEKKELEEGIAQRTIELSEANKELSEQREEIITQRDRLSETVDDLKKTQTQLIQAEKMASLGELTAGIAHEIQNPLNFVNNFSEVSAELMDELNGELDNGDINEAKSIASDVKQNLEKIRHHGQRADFIVKGMLQHSRTGTGERQLSDINLLAEEFLKLSYQGLRSKDKSFNAEIVTNFDKGLPKVNAVQQDIGRVLLNLFNNAFYAVNEKAKIAGNDYKPRVDVATAHDGNTISIMVRDNGTGIPDKIKDKILQPFFTTKPTGEGTGLGLSLSYDMVVKGHGGSIDIDSKENQYTLFTVKLPAT